jgi:hypothetical protein
MVFTILKERLQSATRAELEAASKIKTKPLMMAGRAKSVRFHMCFLHMGLKFVHPTERFVALRL